MCWSIFNSKFNLKKFLSDVFSVLLWCGRGDSVVRWRRRIRKCTTRRSRSGWARTGSSSATSKSVHSSTRRSALGRCTWRITPTTSTDRVANPKATRIRAAAPPRLRRRRFWAQFISPRMVIMQWRSTDIIIIKSTTTITINSRHNSIRQPPKFFSRWRSATPTTRPWPILRLWRPSLHNKRAQCIQLIMPINCPALLEVSLNFKKFLGVHCKPDCQDRDTMMVLIKICTFPKDIFSLFSFLLFLCFAHQFRQTTSQRNKKKGNNVL